MDENAKELCRREERQFGLKANLHALWQELALNFYPERADFTTERALGSEFAIDLFDSEPLRCRRDLGNARASMLRPGGQEWFRAALADDELNERPDIARVLDAINKRARGLIYHEDSGFVRAEKEADHDIVTFGNAIKTAESEIDRNNRRLLMIRAWHPRDCAWLDDANGVRQDVIFRRFKASARHIKKRFPDVELHGDITKALDKENGDLDREFNLCHVMMPADEYDYYKKPKGRKAPWVSVYYDSDHKMLLRERPSERFRYVVDRWATIAGSQYAYSPAAMTALPDGRGIQTMAMVLLEAGEKALDPPMKGVQGAVKGEINSYASGVTWVDREYDEREGPAIEPLLPPNQRPDIGIELINRTTFALRDIWYLTQLTLPQQAKTAYETAQLVEQFIRANIPLFEPWEAGTAMMLSEIFAVLADMRAFGTMQGWPEDLAGQDLQFRFANPLQDAIERNKVNQAQAALGILAGAVQIDPNVAHDIDVGKMTRDAVRGTGAPADWLVDETQAADSKAAAVQLGNIVGGINAAGQAADVANTGLDAAAKLRDLTAEPVGGSAPYGPT